MKKYIGNIVAKSLSYKVDDCYNKCLSLSAIENELPTLIIGLENARNSIEDFSILKKQYKGGMLWWTFSKTERRVDYDADIEEFYKFCINKIVDKVNYVNIDIINLNINKIKEHLNLLVNKDNNRYYFIDNNKFLFIYDFEDTNTIFGVSLSTCAFFGIKKKKVIDLIKSNKKNIEIKNFYSIPNYVRRIINNEIPKEMVLLQYFNKK